MPKALAVCGRGVLYDTTWVPTPEYCGLARTENQDSRTGRHPKGLEETRGENAWGTGQVVGGLGPMRYHGQPPKPRALRWDGPSL